MLVVLLSHLTLLVCFSLSLIADVKYDTVAVVTWHYFIFVMTMDNVCFPCTWCCLGCLDVFSNVGLIQAQDLHCFSQEQEFWIRFFHFVVVFNNNQLVGSNSYLGKTILNGLFGDGIPQ